MKKKTYTPEQKKAYFQTLRDRWARIKADVTAGKLDEIQAIIAEHGLNISPYSFAWVQQQMNAQGLDGTPYLDAKTFQGWKARGFKVRKGERSTLQGITWLKSNGRDDESDSAETSGKNRGYMFPKQYALFHRSQVEAIDGGQAAAEILAEKVREKVPGARVTAGKAAPGIGCLTLDFNAA